MVHETAVIDEPSYLGRDVEVWHFTHLRENAHIGHFTKIGQSCYVGPGVSIGERCRIQNGVSVYQGVSIGNDVFIGPSAVFTNVRYVDPLKKADHFDETIVEDGVFIGANATIVCGVRLGTGCCIGAGAVVTRSVPAGATVVGNPARPIRRAAKGVKR